METSTFPPPRPLSDPGAILGSDEDVGLSDASLSDGEWLDVSTVGSVDDASADEHGFALESEVEGWDGVSDVQSDSGRSVEVAFALPVVDMEHDHEPPLADPVPLSESQAMSNSTSDESSIASEFSYSFPDPLQSSASEHVASTPSQLPLPDEEPTRDAEHEPSDTLPGALLNESLLSPPPAQPSLASSQDPELPEVHLQILSHGRIPSEGEELQAVNYILGLVHDSAPELIYDTPERLIYAFPDTKPELRVLVTSTSSAYDQSCPTVVVVFLDPPHELQPLPPLPGGALYLPILLPRPRKQPSPSISLLDLTPSFLFDSTESLAPPEPDCNRQKAAKIQCASIPYKRLAGPFYRGHLDVPTLENLETLPTEHARRRINRLLSRKPFGWAETTKAYVSENIWSLSVAAVLFGVLVATSFPQAPSLPPPTPATASPTSKHWSILQPLPTSTPTNISNLPTSNSPASYIKEFALSVFSTPEPPARPFSLRTGSTTAAAERYTPQSTGKATVQCDQTENAQAQVEKSNKWYTLDRPLTIDAPPPPPPTPEPTSLSTVLVTSLSRYIPISAILSALANDVSELVGALDELYQILRKHAAEATARAQRAAGYMSERIAARHQRAKRNAQHIRDVGGRFVKRVAVEVVKRHERVVTNARAIGAGARSFGEKIAKEARKGKETCGTKDDAKCGAKRKKLDKKVVKGNVKKPVERKKKKETMKERKERSGAASKSQRPKPASKPPQPPPLQPQEQGQVAMTETFIEFVHHGVMALVI